MQVEGQHWFPYVPPSWLDRLVELVRRSVPQRINAEWCLEADRYSFTPNNASQFVSQIRTLGWIDANGALTELGRNLRLEGTPYSEFMRDEIRRIYDELTDQLVDQRFDRDRANTYFTAASRLGMSGRRQIISVLRWFLVQGGMAEVAERLGGQVLQPQPRQRRATTERRPTAAARPAARRQAGEASGLVLGGITLTISLQLPAVDDERVYQAIFRAMRENLLATPAE